MLFLLANGREAFVPDRFDIDVTGQLLVLDTQEDGGVRLSKATLTRELVLAQIANDDRFEATPERCEIYADLVRFGGRLSLEEYEAIEDGQCKAIEIDR